jgi:hypothetical protein
MKKVVFIIAIATLLVLSVAPVVFAANGQPPRGSCPPNFELHTVEQHENHDHHVGLTVDLNRDNKICVKHVSEERHVHMDNVIRD